MSRLLIIFAIMSNLVHAETIAQKDVDRLNKVEGMITMLDNMYTFGIDVHFNYDLNDMADVKQCAKRAGYYRDEGKKLRDKARNLGGVYGTDMVLAADAAFTCMWCDPDTLDECLQILPRLSSLRVKVLEEWIRLKYGEGKPVPSIKLVP